MTAALSYSIFDDDFSDEIETLAAAGGERLVVVGLSFLGGPELVRTALETDAFTAFHFNEGMIFDPSWIEEFGTRLDGSTGQDTVTDPEGVARFAALVGEDRAAATGAAESYDAAALILLAMQAAGSTDPADYSRRIQAVANAPGEPIYPGELAKALALLAQGQDIDDDGASGVELTDGWDARGRFLEVEIDGGALKPVGYR